MPFQNTRFVAPFVAAHDAVADGRIGDVTGLRAAFGHAGPQAWAPRRDMVLRPRRGRRRLSHRSRRARHRPRPLDHRPRHRRGGGVRQRARAATSRPTPNCCCGSTTAPSAPRTRAGRPVPAPITSSRWSAPRERSTSTTARPSPSRRSTDERERIALPETTGSPLERAARRDARRACTDGHRRRRSGRGRGRRCRVPLGQRTPHGRRSMTGAALRGRLRLARSSRRRRRCSSPGFIDDQPATEVHDDLEVRALFVRERARRAVPARVRPARHVARVRGADP